jgi:integrase
MERGTKTAHPGIARLNKQEMVVRVRVQDSQGNRKEAERRVQTSSVQEALKVQEQLREELLAQLASETGVANVVTGTSALTETLTDFAQRWLKHLEASGRNRQHVIDMRVDKLNRFILPSLGHLRLVEIRPAHLAAWMEWLGSRRMENGQPYRLASLQAVWGVLRTMMRDAVVLAGLRQDVTVGVRFQAKAEGAKHKDVLTQEEVHRLLAEAVHESPDIRAMLVVGFTTGMRFGELSALTWADVDLNRRVVRVAKSQVRGNVGPTKTGNVRTVPLAEAAAAVLKAHHEWQTKPPEGTRMRRNPMGLVFPSDEGTHRYQSMLTRPLARCVERAGIQKHVSAHTMRRTVNNLIRQASGDIVARAVTGHTTVAMTEHYSEVTAVEKLSAQGAALGDLTRVLAEAWRKRGEDMGGSGGNGGKERAPPLR